MSIRQSAPPIGLQSTLAKSGSGAAVSCLSPVTDTPHGIITIPGRHSETSGSVQPFTQKQYSLQCTM